MRRTILPFAIFGLVLIPFGAAPADDKKDDDPHAALIGKSAPDFEADFAVNGKPVKLADLKGKVVMLDFWAVWCGPCVSTFPHLRDLNEEYKDKGLEIVGLTSYFDEMAFKKLKDVADNQKVTKERELLKDFAEEHKLKHLLLPLAEKQWNNVLEKYSVTGIPQVVLIDRKGKVRMVSVGAEEDKAKAIDKMIRKLVDEKG